MTLSGHRQIVKLLLERAADINSTDTQFGATPAGWAIEYLRVMDGAAIRVAQLPSDRRGRRDGLEHMTPRKLSQR